MNQKKKYRNKNLSKNQNQKNHTRRIMQESEESEQKSEESVQELE